jgi:hypothetical protein
LNLIKEPRSAVVGSCDPAASDSRLHANKGHSLIVGKDYEYTTRESFDGSILLQGYEGSNLVTVATFSRVNTLTGLMESEKVEMECHHSSSI